MLCYQVTSKVLMESFRHFRQCGAGQRECQVLWTSCWQSPLLIDRVVHSQHTGHFGGFVLDDAWLNAYWLELASQNRGIRVQVHTHPREAFHSHTDDEFPIVHTPGFLSLVFPDFGMAKASFDGAYLARLDGAGRWVEVPISDHIEVVEDG